MHVPIREDNVSGGCLCVHRHMDASGQSLVWFLKCRLSSYLFIFEMGSLAGLELTKEDRLSGQGAPGSHLSVSNKEGCRWPLTASFLMWAGRGGQSKSSFPDCTAYTLPNEVIFPARFSKP